ncbi:hypothetical protein JCM10908_006702 [Rhodotorula pacifica]|uniref:uncharacterized protein n=1 Tax=Rhodotorula pacifica TaxID=1495444 RepID=UPI003179DD87
MLRRRVGQTVTCCSHAIRRRWLWQCSTFTSPSPTALLDELEQDVANHPPSTVTVFALSKNVPQELVPSFRRTLAPSGLTTTAIGCLSEVLPVDTSECAAPSSSKQPQELFSISLARHRSARDTERAIPFRSALLGRPNIALGREIKPEHQTDHDQLDSGLEAFLKGGAWGFGEQTQAETDALPEIAELRDEDPSSVRELVVLTADRIQPFLAALSRFSGASTVGMVGTSTPFHAPDGAAYSLFYGEESASAGAVGVAVVDAAADHRSKRFSLSYGGLAPVGEAYQVTSAQGNIVLSLSGQNAARLLLNAVNDLFGTSAANLPAAQRTHEKEKEFYAAIFDSEPKFPLDLGQARLVARIMAGDPSRGAMSVETEEEVKRGSYIVFLHQPDSASGAVVLSNLAENQLAFVAVTPSDVGPHRSASECPAQGVVEAPRHFLAASENGVVFSAGVSGPARPPPRVCAIEGSTASLQ